MQAKSISKERKRAMRSAYIRNNWQMYLMVLVPIAFVIIFKYAAYPGLRIAFMNYKPAKGYSGSEYVGLQIFEKIFKDKDFLRALKNSLAFNFLDLLVLYLPHFLSWVIIASVALNLFKPQTGLVNILLMNFGAIDQGIPFLTEKWHWAVTYLLIGVWQNMGWGSIIYLAAITGISPDLYEAATIDGAGRLRKIWNVTLPCIRGTMVTLLIMNLGRVMGSNFERLDSFGSVQVKEFQYQLAIYVYEKGLAGGNFSRATAVGLFQSLTGLILVLISDRVSKALGEDGLL